MTKSCLACGSSVSRTRSRWRLSGRVFCSHACADSYGLVQVACSWSGCAATMAARRSSDGRRFKVDLVDGANYVQYPICRVHRDRLNLIFGKTVKLHAAWRLFTGDDTVAACSTGNRFTRFVLFERANGCCQGCQVKLEFAARSTWQIDHLIPRHRGGLSVRSNLQLLCRICHKRKSAAELTQIAARRRELRALGHRYLTRADKDQIIGQLREEIAILRGRVIDLEQERSGAPNEDKAYRSSGGTGR